MMTSNAFQAEKDAKRTELSYTYTNMSRNINSGRYHR